MDMSFEVCLTVEFDTSVLTGTSVAASLGDRSVSLDYSVTSSGKDLYAQLHTSSQ